MKLTNEMIEKAEFKEHVYRLHDGNGLYLEIRGEGKSVYGSSMGSSRFWLMMYKTTKTYSGVNRILLGTYPEVSLEQARSAAAKGLQMLAMGIDPVENEEKERLRRYNVRQASDKAKVNEVAEKLSEPARHYEVLNMGLVGPAGDTDNLNPGDFPGGYGASVVVVTREEGTLLADNQENELVSVLAYLPQGVLLSYERDLVNEAGEQDSSACFKKVFIPYWNIRSIEESCHDHASAVENNKRQWQQEKLDAAILAEMGE